jgi:hypothetical protein
MTPSVGITVFDSFILLIVITGFACLNVLSRVRSVVEQVGHKNHLRRCFPGPVADQIARAAFPWRREGSAQVRERPAPVEQ